MNPDQTAPKGQKQTRQQIQEDLKVLICLFVCLFVFVALRPMSTAMVIA